MPIRKAKVRRSKWFHEVTQALEDHGFKRGAPGRIVCPGFHFFSRDGYVVQILPNNTLRIERPNGMVDVESVAQLGKANFILDAIVRFIESQA